MLDATLTNDLEDSLVGEVLDDRYEIRKSLDRGGMGTVYLAWDRTLERQVVVKIPHAAPDGGPDLSRTLPPGDPRPLDPRTPRDPVDRRLGLPRRATDLGRARPTCPTPSSSTSAAATSGNGSPGQGGQESARRGARVAPDDRGRPRRRSTATAPSIATSSPRTSSSTAQGQRRSSRTSASRRRSAPRTPMRRPRRCDASSPSSGTFVGSPAYAPPEAIDRHPDPGLRPVQPRHRRLPRR